MKISKVQTTTVYRKILIGFSVVAVLVAALIAYYSLSKTFITVTLKPQIKSTTFSVVVRSNAAEQETNLVAALSGLVTTTEVKGSKAFDNPSTGDEVPAQATGTVTIYNHYTKDQPLAATTRLLTSDGTLFRIKNLMNVPAGGKVENVEVYADQPGKSGNIAPGKFTIPGLWAGLQDKIYAESNSAMTGGVRSGKAITASFINESAQSLINDMKTTALTQLDADATLVKYDPLSTQMLSPVILSQKNSAKDGDETTSLTIDLNVKFVAVLFDQSALSAMAKKTLEDAISSDEQVDTTGKDSLTYSVDTYDVKNNGASLSVKYSAPTTPRLSHPMFNRDKITGKDSQEIKAYFSNFDETQDVQIKFSPFWVTKAPQLKDHVEIKLVK